MNSAKQIVFGAVFVISIAGCAVEGVYPAGPGPYYYDYYYYPSARVYFNISTGYYHYFSDGSWIRAKTLPPKVRLDPRDRHTLKTKERDPYTRNQVYRSRYKPLPTYKPDRDNDRKAREYDRKSYEDYKRNKRR